jgi:putative addiction module killer protein
MVELRRTERFAQWLDALRNVRGRARIQARIEGLAAGNPGDVSPVGEGPSCGLTLVQGIACTSPDEAAR